MTSEKIKSKLKLSDLLPVLVLALITAATTILLVVMERGIQVDESVLSGTLREKCVQLMGEGEFKVVLDWVDAGYAIERPRGIAKLIINTDNDMVAFQVITRGYNPDGLNMLIVMNTDGSIKDLMVYINTETPQIGTKVNERDFLEHFIGLSEEVRIVRGAARNENEIAAITGATRSAQGVANAVNIAVEAYAELFLNTGGDVD
jgi:Na+-translocating ferredoxin:NAD+ oxidoreductase RnfG subunit